MYKIQVLMMSNEWKECDVFAVWDAVAREHVTPEFSTREAAQARIDSDSMVSGWQRDGAVRIVPVGTLQLEEFPPEIRPHARRIPFYGVPPHQVQGWCVNARAVSYYKAAQQWLKKRGFSYHGRKWLLADKVALQDEIGTKP